MLSSVVYLLSANECNYLKLNAAVLDQVCVLLMHSWSWIRPH